MTTQLAPLSFGADQLLAGLAAQLGPEPGSNQWLEALLTRHHRAAAEAGSELDLDEIETTVRERVAHGEAGAMLPRDEVATRAGRHAAGLGHEVATAADVAFVLLEAVRVVAAGPEEEAAGGDTRASLRAGRPRTFRLFVSSTFEDFKAERDVLRLTVFPRLRAFCAQHGARFQAIDLRWGVSEEAGLDQQTVNICLDEIRRCRRVTPRPNFLVLLGNHYGWQPPRPQISAAEFERILERVTPEQRELLARWYRRDDNAVPPEYRLLPRRGARAEYADPDKWKAVETRLRDALVAAAADLEADRRLAYTASATHQEIAAGALASETGEDEVLCYFRELTGHPDLASTPDTDALRRFVDPDQTPLAALKAELKERFPGAFVEHEVEWDAGRGIPGRGRLNDFAEAVAGVLEAAIRRELESPRPPAELHPEGPRIQTAPSLDAEGAAHHDFAEERIRFFTGREEILGTISDYLAGADPVPLAVHGKGGTGKSAVMGEAVRRAQADRPEAELVYRFIGATPASSDARALLESLCRELARRGYGAGESAVPSGYQELVSDFAERLGASAGRPLAVFLDSLDQLSASDGARSLGWLPFRLPEHVRLVVSTRPGDLLEPLERRGAALVELGKMSRADGDALLGDWLEDAGRTLQPEQREAVLDAFEAPEEKGNPLYLKLAFEEARRWTSDEAPEKLARGIEGIIRGNLFDRLAREDSHGKVLVSHALGYLAASRYGLAEDELLDLLSRDPDVYAWFIGGAFHLPPDLLAWAERYDATNGAAPEEWLEAIRKDGARKEELDRFLADVLPRPGGPSLPIVLWSRLSFDLAPYLTEREAEGAVLMAMYHRELGEAATSQYLGPKRALKFHGRLAGYFRAKADPDGDGTWGGEGRSDVRGLSELPFHLAEAKLWDQLTETLTDFRFLERKASDVAVFRHEDDQGDEVATYTGVYRLLEDFDLALRALPGGELRAAERRPLIVTAVDLGEGLAVRCPHCNTSSPLQEQWRGSQIDCPSCGGPLKVNPFVVERAGRS